MTDFSRDNFLELITQLSRIKMSAKKNGTLPSTLPKILLDQVGINRFTSYWYQSHHYVCMNFMDEIESKLLQTQDFIFMVLHILVMLPLYGRMSI